MVEADEMRERQEAMQQAAAERDSEIEDLRLRLEVRKVLTGSRSFQVL